MSNLFIIHSFSNGTKKSFTSYLIRECHAIGLNVIFPEFPTGDKVNFDDWEKNIRLLFVRWIFE